MFLEEFVIDPALQRYGVSEPFVISRMLNLECFSRLEVLDVSSMSDISPYWEGINIIASYIEHTQGAPCLERTRIALRMLPDKFLEPLVAPLMEGGLCYLKQLTINGVAESILEKLGDIYRVGGLAKLTELYLDNPSLAVSRGGSIALGYGIIVSARSIIRVESYNLLVVKSGMGGSR